MKIRHMIAAGLLIGASTAQAAPIFATSTVASWAIVDTSTSWLPFFAPVLSPANGESTTAYGDFTLQRNGVNGVVTYLTSMANVLGIGVFVDGRGQTHRGFIMTKQVKGVAAAPAPVPAPAPAPVVRPLPVPVVQPAPVTVVAPIAAVPPAAAPAPVLQPAPALEPVPAPVPVLDPIAASGDVPAPSAGSVVDEVAAAPLPVIDNIQADAPLAAAPALDANAVPEPASGMLLLAGLAGSAVFARRRSRKA